MEAHLKPSSALSLFGKSEGIFRTTSASKQSVGEVIVSCLLVSSIQAAHSKPPPPMVVQLVRVGLSRLFLSGYVGSMAHRMSGENPN